MRYRGRELTARPFSDETGEGTEHFEMVDGQAVVRVRTHDVRTVSEAEVAANAEAVDATQAAQDAADEREAIIQLMREQVEPAAIAERKQQIQAARGIAVQPVRVDPVGALTLGRRG